MYTITYVNRALDELASSYEEACEIVREHFGIYEPDEVFIEEVDDIAELFSDIADMRDEHFKLVADTVKLIVADTSTEESEPIDSTFTFESFDSFD